MKVLKCAELGNASCMAVFKSDIVDEIVKQASEHAKAAHNANITPEVIEKMKGLVKNEDAPAAAPAQPAAQPAQPAAPAAQPAPEQKPPEQKAAAPAAAPAAQPAEKKEPPKA